MQHYKKGQIINLDEQSQKDFFSDFIPRVLIYYQDMTDSARMVIDDIKKNAPHQTLDSQSSEIDLLSEWNEFIKESQRAAFLYKKLQRSHQFKVINDCFLKAYNENDDDDPEIPYDIKCEEYANNFINHIEIINGPDNEESQNYYEEE